MSSARDQRIVTLLPAATEMVFALGLGARVVGRSHECDYPAEAASIPICTCSRLDAGVSGEAVERQVKALVSEGLSVFQVRADKLKALRPDVIITQALCSVCAVSLDDVRVATARWLDHPCEIISLEPHNLEDVWADLRRIADALGERGAGDLIGAGLRNRFDSISRKAQATPESERRPTVAYIEWCDPLMTAGHWTPELIEIAGGRCVFGEAGAHSERRSFDELERSDPDVIVLGPCGMDMRSGATEAMRLKHWSAWAGLRAVRNGRAYLVDANQYFSRPGPRLADSLEIMAEILHPNRFEPTHRGSAWTEIETDS